MSGRILYLFVKPAHGEPMRAVEVVEAEGGQGLVGDASYGRGRRQVLIVESDALGRFELEPGQLRENMVVEGLPLAGMPAGTRVQAGDALLEVTGDCAPCRFLDDIRDGLQIAMEGQRGILCRVLENGTIRVDDRFFIVSDDSA